MEMSIISLQDSLSSMAEVVLQKRPRFAVSQAGRTLCSLKWKILYCLYTLSYSLNSSSIFPPFSLLHMTRDKAHLPMDSPNVLSVRPPILVKSRAPRREVGNSRWVEADNTKIYRRSGFSRQSKGNKGSRKSRKGRGRRCSQFFFLFFFLFNS